MEERGLRSPEDRLLAFREIAEALNQANDVSSAMAAILPKLGEALGLQTAWAFRYDAARRSFVEVGASGLPPALDACQQRELRTGWCECQSQFVSGRLDKAANLVRCSRLSHAVGDIADLHFHASIPLRSKDTSLGILNLAAPGPTVFTAEALAFLETVGQQVAVAMDRMRMLRQERDKSGRLQTLAALVSGWTFNASVEIVLQRAIESFVAAFGYPVCGITTRVRQPDGTQDEEVLFVAEHSAPTASEAYVYEPETSAAQPQPDGPSVLLAEANSVLVAPIPMTVYWIRLESPALGAFDAIDGDIVEAFSWQLATACINAELYAQDVAHAQWDERRRIAADLHDAVSQRLFSGQLLARTAFAQLDGRTDAAQAQALVARVEALLGESQEEMRDLIRALRPLELETTLVQQVKARIRTLSAQPVPKLALIAPERLRHEPSATRRAALLPIIDEAVHNALKHARAKQILVRIEESASHLSIRVVDDGIGCAEHRIGAGLGTRTLFERAQAMGGTLSISASPEGGTIVSLELPQLPNSARKEPST